MSADSPANSLTITCLSDLAFDFIDLVDTCISLTSLGLTDGPDAFALPATARSCCCCSSRWLDGMACFRSSLTWSSDASSCFLVCDSWFFSDWLSWCCGDNVENDKLMTINGQVHWNNSKYTHTSTMYKRHTYPVSVSWHNTEYRVSRDNRQYRIQAKLIRDNRQYRIHGKLIKDNRRQLSQQMNTLAFLQPTFILKSRLTRNAHTHARTDTPTFISTETENFFLRVYELHCM